MTNQNHFWEVKTYRGIEMVLFERQQRLRLPAMAVQSKSGAYGSLHLHGKRGPAFRFEAWSMDFIKRGCFLKRISMDFQENGVFSQCSLHDSLP